MGSGAIDYQAVEGAAPTKTPFRGTHFSHQRPSGGVLRGALRGASPESSDAYRVHVDGGAPAGVHVYRAGSVAHPSIKGRAHASGVEGNYAVANIDGNERDLWSQAFSGAFKQNVAKGMEPVAAKHSALNMAEHSLKQSGYDGFEASQNHPGSVFLFGDIPTTSS